MQLASVIILSSIYLANCFSSIIEKNGWCINTSPCIKYTSAQKANKPSYMQMLWELGAKSHLLWQEHRHNGRQFIEQMHKSYQEIDENFLNEVINEVIEHEELLEKVANASYKNATGFLKIVLIEGKEGWKIRLHVWEQKEEKEHPHNHKWDFYSKIIKGYLRQEMYETVSNTATCSFCQQYSIREPVSLMPVNPGKISCPCRDDFALTIKHVNDQEQYAIMQLKSIDLIPAECSYFVRNNLIHSIIPSKGAISLVFTSEKVKDNSEVYVLSDATNADIVRSSPSVTKSELYEALLQVRSLLGF